MSYFSIITCKHKGVPICNPGSGYSSIDHPKQETMKNRGETEEDSTVMVQAMVDPRASRHTFLTIIGRAGHLVQ